MADGRCNLTLTLTLILGLDFCWLRDCHRQVGAHCRRLPIKSFFSQQGAFPVSDVTGTCLWSSWTLASVHGGTIGVWRVALKEGIRTIPPTGSSARRMIYEKCLVFVTAWDRGGLC